MSSKTSDQKTMNQDKAAAVDLQDDEMEKVQGGSGALAESLLKESAIGGSDFDGAGPGTGPGTTGGRGGPTAGRRG